MKKSTSLNSQPLMSHVGALKIATLFLGMPFLMEVAAQAADWRQWRGPFNSGMAAGDAPLTWSDTSNVTWKVPVPGRGHSTPVTVGDRIFLTTAVPTGGGEPPRADRHSKRVKM